MSTPVQHQAVKLFTAKQRLALAMPALILVYLSYVFFAFDIPGLIDRARPENGAILMSDMVSYKTHFERDNKTGEFTTAIEGEAKGTYPKANEPDWIQIQGERATVELTHGHRVEFNGNQVVITIPGYGAIVSEPTRRAVNTTLPDGPKPEWLRMSKSLLSINKPDLRIQVAKNKTTVYRYFWGWELFFFDMKSPYRQLSWGELADKAFLDGELPDIIENIWHNSMWRHGDVVWAMFETILMAALGTFGAALITLPLSFFAAKNFVKSVVVRQIMRRFFDLVRGIDGLIWTVILARAFGLGPLTGALAILMTDSGTFGKLFSEALENVDNKQLEGMHATGAKPVLRNRFGVLPQIMPVLLSQVLYFLESNTRSATIIGAIVGGGIGLLLTQAMITQKDWEEVTYYIVWILLVVFIMDALSGRLRRRLIGKVGH